MNLNEFEDISLNFLPLWSFKDSNPDSIGTKDREERPK